MDLLFCFVLEKKKREREELGSDERTKRTKEKEEKGQTRRGTGHGGFRFELGASRVSLTVHDRVIAAIVFVSRIREFVGRDDTRVHLAH